MTWPLLKMIWQTHRVARPQLLALLKPLRVRKQVIHLRSPRELRRFIHEHCEHL